jgi:hypothetical protein
MVVSWIQMHGTIQHIWVSTLKAPKELAEAAPQLLQLYVDSLPEKICSLITFAIWKSSSSMI